MFPDGRLSLERVESGRPAASIFVMTRRVELTPSLGEGPSCFWPIPSAVLHFYFGFSTSEWARANSPTLMGFRPVSLSTLLFIPDITPCW